MAHVWSCDQPWRQTDVGWWKGGLLNHVDVSHHCERNLLCSVDGEGDSEVHKTFRVVCWDGGPVCLCCQGGLAEESERGIGTWNGMESDPLDPTEHGCHIVHCDLVDLVSIQDTCCAGLCRQQCG